MTTKRQGKYNAINRHTSDRNKTMMMLRCVCWHEDLGDIQYLGEWPEQQRREAEAFVLEQQQTAHTGEIYYLRIEAE